MPPADEGIEARLREAAGLPQFQPDMVDVRRRKERLTCRRRRGAVAVGVLGTALTLGTMAFLLIRLGAADGIPARTSSPASISPSSGTGIPEGTLLLGFPEALHVLRPGDEAPAYVGEGWGVDVSPAGTEVLASVGRREPTGVWRTIALVEVDLDSLDRTVLVEAEPRESLGPAEWSSDGTKLLYLVARFPTDPAREHPGPKVETEMPCVLDAASGATRCFPQLGIVYSAHWSPDGRTLIVAGHGRRPVQVVDIVTGDRRVLVPPGGSAAIREAIGAAGFGVPVQFVEPRFSSTGRYVSSLASVQGGDAFHVPVVLDSAGNLVALGTESREGTRVLGEWSPTGDRLVYTVGEPPYSVTELRLLDLTTSADRILISTGEGPRAPVIAGAKWSPSGRWLAVAIQERSSAQGFPVVLRILDMEGDDPPREMALGTEMSSEPLVAWGP